EKEVKREEENEEKKDANEEEEAERMDEKEEREEGGKEEERAPLPSSSSLDVKMDEGVEIEEKQQEGVLSPRWSRTNVVDEDEDDNRSSEYQKWLTRDDGMATGGGVSLAVSSWESEAEMVPLLSSLSSTSWGKGIEINYETAMDDTSLHGEKTLDLTIDDSSNFPTTS
ncbi:hypothetical protein PMAYCL1PPCAC_07962, partial [Pristionchus mayeri]